MLPGGDNGGGDNPDNTNFFEHESDVQKTLEDQRNCNDSRGMVTSIFLYCRSNCMLTTMCFQVATMQGAVRLMTV